jgi:hypothetical protein
MEATVVLVLFLVVICGGMTLMLAAGYQSVEKNRARRAAPAQPSVRPAADVPVLVELPSFLPELLAPVTPLATVAFVFDDAMVRRLERHVRIEQALVAQFVHHPSVDNLYRPTGAALNVH